MLILVGNTHPIVGHKQADGSVIVEELPEGEYVTEVVIPTEDVLFQLSGLLPLHIKNGVSPAWIECEDKELEAAIAKYYGIEDNKRPDHWGDK